MEFPRGVVHRVSIGPVSNRPSYYVSSPLFIQYLGYFDMTWPNQSPQHNSGSRPSSDDSPEIETPSSPGARG